MPTNRPPSRVAAAAPPTDLQYGASPGQAWYRDQRAPRTWQVRLGALGTMIAFVVAFAIGLVIGGML